jgi:predicted small secreted protein
MRSKINLNKSINLKNNSNMKILRYIFPVTTAIAAGLIYRYLTTTQSGKMTRDRIMEGVDKAKQAIGDAANKKVEEAKKSVSNTMESVHNKGKESINNPGVNH